MRLETLARRQNILRLLCRHRHMTIKSLADEFGVFERTIRRDIELLSLTEPIYTQTGRHEGGVYISNNYAADKIGMSRKEVGIFEKLIKHAENTANCFITPEELTIAKLFLADYVKATTKF